MAHLQAEQAEIAQPRPTDVVTRQEVELALITPAWPNYARTSDTALEISRRARATCLSLRESLGDLVRQSASRRTEHRHPAHPGHSSA